MNLVHRLLCLMGLILSLNATAQTKVSLKFESADFEEIIEAIQRQTAFHFVFSESKIPKKKVTIQVQQLETIAVLDQLFKGTGYGYSILPDYLIVIQSIEKKNTDQDTVKTLNEVVITALGIEKDNRKIGYALSTIQGSSISKARESNMIMALQGRVAGLNISGVNGGPSSSARILLRGVVGMSASAPLFVVNGIPIDNNLRGSANEYGGADYGDGISNINPDDIETINILRSSAASALYGARAANGVILINLKKGVKNEHPTFEYNTNLSFDRPVNNTDFQYIYGQGTQNKRPADFYDAISTGILSWGEKMDGKLTPQINGSSLPYLPVKNNMQRFYRTAPAFTNTLSLVGGNTNSIYRISASNLDHSSILQNGHLNRKTFNVYGAFDPTKQLNISFNGNLIDENNRNNSYLSDGPLNANYGIAALATSLPQAILAPGYDQNTGNETRWNSDEYKTNPYFVMNKQADHAKRTRYISSSTAKYKFNNWVSVQGRIGYDLIHDDLVSVLPTGTAFSTNRQGGINAYDKTKTTELNTDILLSANRDLFKHLNVDLSIGANYRERNSNALKIKGSQFLTPNVYKPENLFTRTTIREIAKIVTQSAYYSADLAYKHFLNFSITGRIDTYSTLPSNNRAIFVPGYSGSLIFSDLIDIKNLSFGKFRVDFVKTSGEPSVPYTTQIYYTTENQINGIPSGSFSVVLPNQNLKPFILNEFETGLNLRFFENRLDFDFTYFHRVTHNEIINAKQSIATGFTTAYVNLGKTQNIGTEFTLKYTHLSKKELKWQFSFNLTRVSNKLLSIDGSNDYTLSGAYRPLNANTAFVVGKPITQIMAYDYKRDASGNIVIGSDGIPKRGNFIPMGSTIPNLYGGFNTTFTFKQINMSLLIDFRFGNKILSATENYSYVQGLNKATLSGRETGITAKGVLEDGTNNTINIPAYTYYPELATNISALAVLNGSFIKFRQATIGYIFKLSTLKKTPFSNISIDLVGRNLFTFLKYTKNIDPESEFSPLLAYAGIEGASLPTIRTLGLNVNFKFK